MSKLTKALTAAAGNAGGDKLYVEDVFSTYLYDGTGAAQTITNDIDLDGEGGLVWLKERTNLYTDGHWWVDTLRGANDVLKSNTTGAEVNITDTVTAFNSDGFSLGANASVSSTEMASFTFRKAEKFFDIQTWTGNSTAGRQISHSLGSTPGFIIVKGISNATAWWIFHTSTGATKFLEFSNQTPTTDNASWNNTAPTDSVFTLGSDVSVNGSGRTYVAYLFASDAGGFGDDGDENIIKCASYTGNGVEPAGPIINLGFEPQWILIKDISVATNWTMFDCMRGTPVGGADARLFPNLTNAENNFQVLDILPTGFQLRTSSGGYNENNKTYIYVAIRRPMKTPESGTEVFALKNPGYPVDSNGLAFTSGFPVDFALSKEVSATDGWLAMSRLQGNGNRLRTNTTEAEAGGISYGTFDHNTGWYSTASANMSWMFKRAPGFFDVVAYTGKNSATTQAHNLGVVPELMIIKKRDTTRSWIIYSKSIPINQFLTMPSPTAAATFSMFNDTAPTPSVFSLGTDGSVNASAGTYIAYLFASLAGVSKVGSYIGSGNNLNVDCGFSAGARFILIKRTDATGDFYLYDSVRGIVAGNDPYTFLNSSAAQVTNTDYIDPLSSGFTVTSSAPAALNASGGNYIFLAIA